MAAYSSVLAWRIPWTEEPGGLQSIGYQSWTQLKRLSTPQFFVSFPRGETGTGTRVAVTSQHFSFLKVMMSNEGRPRGRSGSYGKGVNRTGNERAPKSPWLQILPVPRCGSHQ